MFDPSEQASVSVGSSVWPSDDVINTHSARWQEKAPPVHLCLVLPVVLPEETHLLLSELL